MSVRMEVGYVCRHGHFQFVNDPDGDACGTKRVATVYVEADTDMSAFELADVVDQAISGLHEKVEYWRKNAE